jgi:hypothetical protein
MFLWAFLNSGVIHSNVLYVCLFCKWMHNTMGCLRLALRLIATYVFNLHLRWQKVGIDFLNNDDIILELHFNLKHKRGWFVIKNAFDLNIEKNLKELLSKYRLHGYSSLNVFTCCLIDIFLWFENESNEHNLIWAMKLKCIQVKPSLGDTTRNHLTKIQRKVDLI